ncbi:MAG: hypothetical protein R3E62_00760 [Pseudomonadales bacterium]
MKNTLLTFFIFSVSAAFSILPAHAQSVASISKEIDALPKKKYTVMGFYPGMPRSEAFAVANALSNGKIKSMADSQGIYYAQRTPTHLKITVNFPDFADGSGNAWNAQTAPANQIKIETKLPDNQTVVSDQVRAEMIEKYGQPNVADMATRVGFSPVDTKNSTQIAFECKRTMRQNGVRENTRELYAATSQLSDNSIGYLQENCPALLDDFIDTKRRQLGPLLNVHYKPGYQYITYHLDYEAASRFSKKGQARCEMHPSSC